MTPRKLWMLSTILGFTTLAAAGSADRAEFNKAVAATPDIVRGELLYGSCIACHGRDGGGVVAGTTPRIAGQHFRVLVRQIVDYRYGKRWDMRMEDVAKSHRALSAPQEIADVSAYISAMPRDSKRGVGDGTHAALGATVYGRHCMRCHGMYGEGDDMKQIPRIGGQHAGYLSRQIYDAVDGRRLPLTRTHRARLEPLSFQEVLGLADHISRMGWPADAPAPIPEPQPR